MRMRRENDAHGHAQRERAELGGTCSSNCANGGMFPDRTRPSDPRMAAIRSNLSHSASLLTRNYPNTQPVPGSRQGRGENFAGTAPPFTREHSVL